MARARAEATLGTEEEPMLAHRPSLAIAFTLIALLPGCFTGSGRLETRTFAIDGFDAVEAGRYISVEVVHGDPSSVVVTADDNLWSELAVRREGDALVLSLSNAHAIYENVTVRAVATTPSLARLDLSGGARGTLRGFDAPLPALAVHASGGSSVEGGARAEDLSVELSGGSRAALAGAATTLTLDASGGSAADLIDVEAGAAAVWLSGGSRGAVTASGRLDYHLSGASHLDYAGDPELGRADASGGSGVTRR